MVGAIGGGFVGNELASKDQTLVWDIGVRYDDGSYATVQQTSAPGLRIGDRVRVTSTGIELSARLTRRPRSGRHFSTMRREAPQL